MTNLILPVPKWRVEDGTEAAVEEGADIYHAPVIENQEADTLWYSLYFVSREHINYLGLDDSYGPYALSIRREETQVRAILWLNEGPEMICFKLKPKATITPGDVLKQMHPTLSRKRLREVKSTALHDELFNLEQKTAIRGRFYKFGVLYAKPGQKTEAEMFNNRIGSPEFDKFLGILGEKIQLKSWKAYDAGLDTRFDRTGKQSVYTKFLGYEIMYHVSTLLPFTEDTQQIERKQHIGNDIVLIIFQDAGSTQLWNPECISSRFPHLYAVVRPSPDGTYACSFAIRDSLKPFGPPTPHPPVFVDPVHFRNFLLAKCINGEREALRSSPSFRSADVLHSFLKEIFDKFPKTLTVRSSSSQDVKSGGNDKEPLFETSLPTIPPQTLIQKPNNQFAPFQVKPIFSMSNRVTCSDTWGNYMIVGTTDGLYVFDPLRLGAEQWFKVPTHTSEKYFAYSQLDVVDSLGILVTRMPKIGIVIYDLGSLFDEDGPSEFRVDKTKGSSKYSLGASDETLYIFCAVKSDILVLRWNEDRFIPTHAVQISQEPKCLVWWRSHLIVAVDNQFQLINPDPDNPVCHPLYTAAAKETQALDAVVLNEELLLCFNNHGTFVNIEGSKTRNYDIKWSSIPSSFVYIYPYLLAFSPVNIEVRTMVNGSLVQTIAETGMASISLLTTSQGIFYGAQSDSALKSMVYQLKLGVPAGAPKKAGMLSRRTISSPVLSIAGHSDSLHAAMSVPPSFVSPRAYSLMNINTSAGYPGAQALHVDDNSEEAADDLYERGHSLAASSTSSQSSSPRDILGKDSASRLKGSHSRRTSTESTPPLSPTGNAKRRSQEAASTPSSTRRLSGEVSITPPGSRRHSGEVEVGRVGTLTPIGSPVFGKVNRRVTVAMTVDEMQQAINEVDEDEAKSARAITRRVSEEQLLKGDSTPSLSPVKKCKKEGASKKKKFKKTGEASSPRTRAPTPPLTVSSTSLSPQVSPGKPVEEIQSGSGSEKSPSTESSPRGIVSVEPVKLRRRPTNDDITMLDHTLQWGSSPSILVTPKPTNKSIKALRSPKSGRTKGAEGGKPYQFMSGSSESERSPSSSPIRKKKGPEISAQPIPLFSDHSPKPGSPSKPLPE